jgi:hypothetical protein
MLDIIPCTMLDKFRELNDNLGLGGELEISLGSSTHNLKVLRSR